MFITLYNTGARVSEIIGLRVSDLCLESKASILIHGKGRKQRTVPLWNSTKHHLKKWLFRLAPDSGPLFPSRCGRPLSRAGVEYRLRLAVKNAAERFPSLKKRRQDISSYLPSYDGHASFFSPALISPSSPSGLDMRALPRLICMSRLI